jgi:sortase A
VSDKPSLDDLTIEELEELLEAKRRSQRAKLSGATGARHHDALRGREKRESSPGSRWGARLDRGQQPALQRPFQDAFLTGLNEAEAERSEARFKAVEITPLVGVWDRIAALLRKLGRSFWRSGFPRLRDRLLLLLELAALAGLIFVVFSSLSDLRTLNREVAEALESGQVSTPAVTPVAVLPGSSFPPGSADRVPDLYRHLVEPGTTIPIPTPGPRQPSRVVIPSLGVDAPVVQGDGWEELKMGAGHHIGSANPGERGNMVISGHNDVYGEIFKDLGDLKLGDGVIVYAGDTPYTYKVVAKRIVEPSEVSLLEATPDATLTLITCYPYLVDTHRIVVIAELANQ